MSVCVGGLYKLSSPFYDQATQLRLVIEANFEAITSTSKDWNLQIQLKRAKADLNTKRSRDSTALGLHCFRRDPAATMITTISMNDEVPAIMSSNAVDVICTAADLITRSTWNITGKCYFIDDIEICIGHCDRTHAAASLIMEVIYRGYENAFVAVKRIEKIVEAVTSGVNMENLWIKCDGTSLEGQWRALLQEIS